MRTAYVRLKSMKNTKLSEKNLEYFLFIFKSLKMYPEVIDICENFDKLTGSASTGSEIRDYYLSDTLL